MKESTIVGPKAKRELATYTQLMRDAARDMVLGAGSFGINLKCVHDKDLFLVTHKTWESYIKEEWELTPSRSYELMRLGERLPEIMEKAKALGLPTPTNEWQLRPLLKLPPSKSVEAYVNAATKAKEDKVVLSQAYVEPFAEEVREVEATILPPAAPAPKIEPKIEKVEPEEAPSKKFEDFQFEDDEDDVSDPRLEPYSNKAKDTIQRVGDEISPQARESILAGTLKISDKELVDWGTYDGENFKALGKYLIESRWLFGKAKKFLFQKLDTKTKAETMINLAIASGGKRRLVIGDWTFDVYKTSK